VGRGDVHSRHDNRKLTAVQGRSTRLQVAEQGIAAIVPSAEIQHTPHAWSLHGYRPRLAFVIKLGSVEREFTMDLRNGETWDLTPTDQADEMSRRGYRSIRDDVSGSDVYSYYQGHGNCVTVRLDGQRRVRSIVAGPDFDCRR
jgi:hypothetical protein